MRIKRLDICGFKSFMDRVVFSFGDGITGVVGPNGCGKSNVVDAIRWVMGEQSAKHLRGRSMEDVIFNGSESKAPLSMAEVTLTFHNDHPELLSAQYRGFSEIAVSRRLFRSGESHYLINRTPCRLLDVTELFLGTGVGTKAYSIIEQGRIGLVVSAKPEDRRSLIEEAAGVTRYKSRRKAAERKMEHTEQNLLRVGDIVSEIGRRLDSLNRQARKAERYKKLKAEMREIELHAASHRWLELSARMRAARAAIEGLSGEERDFALQVGSSEAAIDAARAALASEERAAADLSERAHAVDNALKVGEANLGAWAREAAQSGARGAEAERELREIAAAVAALEAERQEALAELHGLSSVASGDEARLAEVEATLQRLGEDASGLERRRDEERQALVHALSSLAAVKSQLESLARQRTDLEARHARARAEKDELASHVGELDQARHGHLSRLGQRRQLRLALEERRAGEEEALERSRRERDETQAALTAAREGLSERRSRLASLTEIARSHEGCGRGARAVVLRAGERTREEGILGLLSDLVRAPSHVEKAIEAALGERLQAVVVADRERAAALATWLRETREGRGTFLPVDLAAALDAPAPDSALPGLVGRALDLVAFEAEVAPLVRALLSNVWVVQDLPSALAGAKAGAPHVLVTLDGEVIEPTGAIAGGAHEGPAAGMLQRRRELAELAREVAVLDTEHLVAQERHRRLAERVLELEASLKGLAGQTHTEALSLVEEEKDLHKASEDLSRARGRLDKLSTEADALERAVAALFAEEAAAQAAGERTHVERQGHEARLTELSQALAALAAREEDLVGEQTGLKVKVAADAERRGALDQRIARVASATAEAGERQTRVEASRADAVARAASLEERSTASRAELEALAAEHATLASTLEAAREGCEAAAARLAASEAEVRGVRRRLDELQAGLSEQALKEREHALELQHLVESLRERHGVELTHELSRFHCVPPPPREAAERLRELKEHVERMGEINLTAIEEHKELSDRYEFLSTQKKDLERSLALLKKAIVRINRTSRERFQETFAVVNEKFQQVFPRLFNGGRASLVLVEGDETQEGGIEILAQPPGKKLQSVGLLSGGEKALTAVSLIFAIFLIKPTPFCLLDEVDAPLDDVNVGRYNDLVREMCSLSQFILITHNKRTMQIADTLYGVTMEEPGVSKLVSVRLDERAAEEPVQASA